METAPNESVMKMVCETIEWCWCSLFDKKRREFIDATRKLRNFHAKIHVLIQLNNESLTAAQKNLRVVEEELKQDLNEFMARFEVRENEFVNRCLQRGVTPAYARKDVESWLDTEELNLKFLCVQKQSRVKHAKRRIQSLQGVHNVLNEHLNTAQGWQMELLSNEHLRSMTLILKGVDGKHVEQISNRCGEQVEAFISALDRIDSQVDSELPAFDAVASLGQPISESDVFWDRVMADTPVQAFAEPRIKHNNRVMELA